MAHEKLALKGIPTGSSDRSFGMVFGVVFLIIIALWSLCSSGGVGVWAIISGTAFFIVMFSCRRRMSL